MPAADPGFDCCHDSGGHARDCEVIARAEQMRASISTLVASIRVRARKHCGDERTGEPTCSQCIILVETADEAEARHLTTGGAHA